MRKQSRQTYGLPNKKSKRKKGKKRQSHVPRKAKHRRKGVQRESQERTRGEPRTDRMSDPESNSKNEKIMKRRKGIWQRTNRKPKGMRKSEWLWKQQRMEQKKTKCYKLYRWYWGIMTQKEAEEHLLALLPLKPESFLVHGTLFQELTTVIISVVTLEDKKDPKVYHFQTSPKADYWQLDGCPDKHRNLVALVSHYRHNRIGRSGLRLAHAAPQPEWLIQTHHIIAPNSAPVLGKGNFGCVMVGAYCRRLVAVKKLLSKGDKLMEDRDGLMREALLMRKLENAYITKLIGISIDTMPPMMLVEIMVVSLEKHLELNGKETSFEEKMLYCLQIAKGLAHMSKVGIVHRDLAVRNVLISRYGTMKIADFGMSDYESNLNMVNMCGENLPCNWMAPESLRDLSVAVFSEKTDVWGFAVTCNQVFENGEKPLRHIETNGKKDFLQQRVINHGSATHVPCKGIPPEVISYLFDKCMNMKPEARPVFSEIVRTFDVWIKMKYFPPPPHLRSLNKLKNCNPLTMAEYEILYANNIDWVPPVRRGKHKKKEHAGNVERKKKRLEKIEKLKKKNPQKVLKKFRRRLRKRKHKMQIRKKLRLMRQLRRERKTRVRLLKEILRSKSGSQEARRKKKIRPTVVKLVLLYRRLMRVKFRKRAPNRQTRLRLQPARCINNKSAHPVSRNGKEIRVKSGRPGRLKKDPFKRPAFPNIKKWAKRPLQAKNTKGKKKVVRKKKTGALVSMKKKRKEKRLAVLRKKLEDANRKRKVRTTSGAKSLNSSDVKNRKMLKLLRKKNRKKKMKRWRKMMRKNKKRRRRKRRDKRNQRLRKRHRRKNRKIHRLKRRVRRRKVRLRRYRRHKEQIRLRSLKIEQKEKMKELNMRRRERQRRLHRKRRREKIGRILKRWRILRRIMKKTVVKQALRRQTRLLQWLEMKKEPLKKKKQRDLRKMEKKAKKDALKTQKNKERRQRIEEKMMKLRYNPHKK